MFYKILCDNVPCKSQNKVMIIKLIFKNVHTFSSLHLTTQKTKRPNDAYPGRNCVRSLSTKWHQHCPYSFHLISVTQAIYCLLNTVVYTECVPVGFDDA
jgi:hypothetical protein